MPRLDKYRLGGDEHVFANVTSVVGPNGINYPADVMLVQALLAYLPPHWRGVPDKECPVVSGTFDNLTRNAIEQYQMAKNREPHNGPRVIEDGRVSPAIGKFSFGRNEYIWTIVCLNTEASAVSAMSEGLALGYIDKFAKTYSQLGAALKGSNN